MFEVEENMHSQLQQHNFKALVIKAKLQSANTGENSESAPKDY